MEFEPPRARKKYSQTWEYKAASFHRSIRESGPTVLQTSGEGGLWEPGAVLAALFSIIPGLGYFYLTRNLKTSLLQFGVCAALFLSYFFTFGTWTGALGCMALLGLHQYFMYRAYLKGLENGQIPFPGLWKGMGISAIMVLILSILYSQVFIGSLQGRLFYAQKSLGDAITQGDRFLVTSEKEYHPGDIVAFNRGYYYRHGSSGELTLVERILAVPGDQVSVSDGAIQVNGRPLSPELRPLEDGLSIPEGLTVPEGRYLILYGNIQTNTRLTVDWFLVPREDIQGKLSFRYSPLGGSLN